MEISDAHFRMDIIIISVFQKCKGTQLLAHEDGTQMFCSDDLYFFNVVFFFPTTRKLPIHSSNLFWKSNILEKEENSKLFKVLLRVSLKMQPIYALFYASSPIKHKNLSRC